MKNYYLYKITNKVNDKSYIGLTQDPSSRKWQHLNIQPKENSWASLVTRAVDKYSKDNFEFTVLCVGSKNYISELENKAITLYNTVVPNGYNIKPGGIEDFSGYKVTGRLSDTPLYIRGFWFPNLRTCADKLNVDKTTVIKWNKEGTAAEQVRERKLREDSLECPCYVGGFWFPVLSVAVISLDVGRSTLQKRIKAGYIEQQDNKSLVKGDSHPNTIPVNIQGTIYPSILEASRLSGYKYHIINYRLKNNKEGFSYA